MVLPFFTIKSIKNRTKIPLDTNIMISEVACSGEVDEFMSSSRANSLSIFFMTSLMDP
jgi:hypothetical protein